jgi:tight adherence protein C
MGLDVLLLLAGLLGIFLAIFLVLTAVGVFTNEARGVSKSLAVIEAFSAAPPEMQRELAPSFQDRVVTPLLDKSLAISRKFAASDQAERIRHKLEVAGNPPGWTVDRVTSLKFVGFVFFLAIGLLVSTVFGFGLAVMLVVCVGAAILGFNAPNLYLYQLGYDRTHKMQRALPDALELLTI